MCFHMLHFFIFVYALRWKVSETAQGVFETPLLGLGPRHFFNRYPGR